MNLVKSWLDTTDAAVSIGKSVTLTSDGFRIQAAVHCRRQVARRPGAVLILGFLRSDGRELQRLASFLACYGWAALRLDLRGNGLSQGHPDDINGYVDDALAGLRFLLDQAADPCRIFLVGQSLGAAVAITAGAADPRVSGVVALHPGCGHDLGAFDPPHGHADVRRPLESVALLSPRPLLIIAGERDPVLPCSMARVLYEAAGDPKRMLEIKDGAHAVEDTDTYALGWLLAGAPRVWRRESPAEG